jgi:CheY-like chemotaxis protein
VRVLLVDEDRIEGGLLAFHLRREGCIVMLMDGVEEASDAMAWASPDVVVVDVSARGFETRSLLERLAEDDVDTFATIESQPTLEVELDHLRLGVLETLVKPLDPRALARRIHERPRVKAKRIAGELPPGAIPGELARHPTLLILQLMRRHALSARLHVEIEGDWGVLVIRHGDLIDAETPSAAGREAALAVLRLERGGFVLFPLEPDADELGREDVIRSALPALVAEALPPLSARSRRPTTRPPPVNFPPRRPAEDEFAASRDPGASRMRRSVEPALSSEAGEAAVLVLESTVPPPFAPRTGPTSAPRPRTQPSLAELARYDHPASAEVDRRRALVEPMLEATVDEAQWLGASPPARPLTSPRLDRLTSRRLRAKTDPGQETEPRADTDRNDRPDRARPGPTDRSDRPDRARPGPTDRSDRPDRARPGPTDRSDRPDTEAVASVQHAAMGPEPWEAHSSAKRSRVSVAALVGLVVIATAFAAWRLAAGSDRPDDSFAARFGRALLALDAGQRDNATAALRELAGADEAPLPLLVTLARMAHEDGRLDETRTLLERALARAPDAPDLHLWRALVALEQADPARAREALARAKMAGASEVTRAKLEALLDERP